MGFNEKTPFLASQVMIIQVIYKILLAMLHVWQQLEERLH